MQGTLDGMSEEGGLRGSEISLLPPSLIVNARNDERRVGER